MMLDLSKLNELGGGVPKSKAIQPKANGHVRIEKQQELEEERQRFLREQRERVANTSTMKLEIIKAIKDGKSQDKIIQMLVECISVATGDKSFKDMCQKS